MYEGTGVLKGCTLILNVFVFVSGISITLLGANGLADDAMNDDRDLRAILITMTVLGSLIIIITVVGSCAILSDNTTLLNLYTFICFVSAILLLVTAIVVFVFKNRITDKQTKAMEKRFNRFELGMPFKNITTRDRDNVDYVQRTLKCCGWTKVFPETAEEYPSSCTCAGSENKCVHYRYTNTCSKLFTKHAVNTILATGWVCIIVLFLQVFCVATTAKMVNRMKGFNIIRDLS